jgi:hypothetical protein
VVALLSGDAGGPNTADQYRWKLLARPSPVANVAIAVDQSDRPVFHIAGIPCRCRLAGAERWVMVAVDAMTAPAFRRQGLLTTHTTQLFARWRAAGVALVLGLPNDNWRSRARALGWTPLGRLQWLVLPLRPERLLARKLGVPWLAHLEHAGRWWRALAVDRRADPSVEVREVTAAGAEFDALWLRASPALGWSLTRDRAWVTWRYLAAPGSAYRVLLATRSGEAAGYAACGTRGPRRATIAEVFTAPGDTRAFTALVRAAIAQATANGADSIRALAAPGSWPHRAFLRAGFFRSRHAFDVEYVPLDPSIGAGDVRTTSDWYLMGGDFDAI